MEPPPFWIECKDQRHFRADTVPCLDYAYQPDVIEVKHGCVLIPVCFAMWWYYTRRAAKKALRLLTMGSDSCFQQGSQQDQEQQQSSPPGAREKESTWAEFDAEQPQPPQHNPQPETDQFSSWEEVLANNSKQSSSMHLVRWITSHRKMSKRRRMRAISKASLNQLASQYNNAPSVYLQEDQENMPRCDGLLSFDDALSTSTCSRWECIDDRIEMLAVQKASLPDKALVDDDSHLGGIVV